MAKRKKRSVAELVRQKRFRELLKVANKEANSPERRQLSWELRQEWARDEHRTRAEQTQQIAGDRAFVSIPGYGIGD